MARRHDSVLADVHKSGHRERGQPRLLATPRFATDIARKPQRFAQSVRLSSHIAIAALFGQCRPLASSRPSDHQPELYCPGFSGEKLASENVAEGEADVHETTRHESPSHVRIYQSSSKTIQRAIDVSGAESGSKRLLRMAQETGFEPRSGRLQVASFDPRFIRRQPRHLWVSSGFLGPPRGGRDLQ